MGCFCAKLENRVNDKFAGSRVILQEMLRANLQYQGSTGCCQTRGNGALVLTPVLLWLGLWCINKEIEISLQNMWSVEAGSLNIPGKYGVHQAGLIIDYVTPLLELKTR